MFLHIDVDAFFASAEQAYNPKLKNIPMAVGSRSNLEIFSKNRKGFRLMDDNSGAFVTPVFYIDNTRTFEEYFVDTIGEKRKIRGIITSASYEARACGVKTGMPIAQALRLCPHMIVVPSHMRRYHQLSLRLYRYLQRMVPLVEQYSIDEFFADTSGWVKENENLAYALKIQSDIKTHFDLPVSIGICRAKWIAKLATEYAKPFGIYYVEDIAEFIEDIPIEEFPGIGRGFARRLRAHRIRTLGELSRSRALLHSWKKPGRQLYAKVIGEDREGIAHQTPRKSIGISRTFDPLSDSKEIKRRLMIMARHIAYMAENYGVKPTRYHLRIKYADGSRFKRNETRKEELFSETFFKSVIAKMYLCYAPKHLPAVKLALSVSGLQKHTARLTPSLFHIKQSQKFRALSKTAWLIREKWGLDAIKHGSEL